MSRYGSQNQQRGHSEDNRSSGGVHYNPALGVPAGKVIPGFLIVQKNGVVRMNKNYKGESFGPDSFLKSMF